MIKEATFDEVFDAQNHFRKLLDALSHPGKIYQLDGNKFTQYPEGFESHVLSILKTLGDNCVTFFVGSTNRGDFSQYIHLNTGMLPAPAQSADYACFDGSRPDDRLTSLNTGTPEFPEKGATAIITVGKISREIFPGKTLTLTLAGPGIRDTHIVHVSGLDRSFVEQICEKNQLYPQGMDVIFTDHEGHVCGMPRTTKAAVN